MNPIAFAEVPYETHANQFKHSKSRATVDVLAVF